MGTFLEIVITATLTFGTGFLFLKYQSHAKQQVKRSKLSSKSSRLTTASRQLKNGPGQVHINTTLRRAYQDYSPKFILIILLAMTFFSSVFYLAERGIIILKW